MLCLSQSMADGGWWAASEAPKSFRDSSARAADGVGSGGAAPLTGHAEQQLLMAPSGGEAAAAAAAAVP